MTFNMPLNQPMVFGEGPAHAAPQIKAWCSPHERTGRQFIH